MSALARGIFGLNPFSVVSPGKIVFGFSLDALRNGLSLKTKLRCFECVVLPHGRFRSIKTVQN
jgi:hypothetical protein